MPASISHITGRRHQVVLICLLTLCIATPLVLPSAGAETWVCPQQGQPDLYTDHELPGCKPLGEAKTYSSVESYPASEPRPSTQDPFTLLHAKPLSESATLIPQLIAKSKALPPPYLYELSRRLWATDKHAAMEWFAVGKARALYDAYRCVDKSSHQGVMYLPAIASEVLAGIEADRAAYGRAGLRALARPDIFLDAMSPLWICSHGVAAANSAIQGKPLATRDWLRPPTEWEGIRQNVRAELNAYFIEQGRPQNDPILMSQSKFTRVKLHTFDASPLPNYGWIDNHHLVTSITEKGPNGKPVQRLIMFGSDGMRQDVATTSGIWCAGIGIITYQTASESFSINEDRVTLAAGLPGRWSSLTVDLRRPFDAVFGAQSFRRSWGFKGNATSQSPFDCRWVTDKTLFGVDHRNQWVPLMPGDGSVLLELQPGGLNVQWINSKGRAVKLPVDPNQVSLQSVRYVPWKQGYFIAPTWGRSENNEKVMPSCVGGAFIFPSNSRIEEVCLPFDKDTRSDVVTFTPSPAGWLRITGPRKTAHGPKAGGVYLVRSGVRAEKLVDTFLESWNLSPDGCQLAFTHRTDSNSPVVLELLDLCHES